jgi:hypothetical protein
MAGKSRAPALLGSLSSKAEKTVKAMCEASLSVIIGDGASTKLWTDI